MKTILLLPIFLLGLTPVAGAADERPPNIVFIVADDLGWSDTNSYGSTFYETPNISRLERDGIMLMYFVYRCPIQDFD